MSSSSSSSGQEPDSNPLLHAYNEWILRTPFITRNMLLGITAIYLLSFYYDPVHQLANIPAYTVGGLQLYRLVLSPLVGNSIFSLLMIYFFFPVMGGRIEQLLGSTSYVYLMVLVTVLANATYVLACYFFWAAGGMADALYWRCQGFWLVIFGLITIECMQDPETPRRLLFIPIDIPGKYFPLALYAFFFLLGGADLGSLISIGIGYAYVYGHIPQWLLLSSTYIAQVLEAPRTATGNTLGGGEGMGIADCCLRCQRGVEGLASRVILSMSAYPGYILAAAATAGTNLNDNAETNGVAGATPWGTPGGARGQPQQQQQEPTRFAGRGHTIGNSGSGSGSGNASNGASGSLFGALPQWLGGGGSSGSGARAGGEGSSGGDDGAYGHAVGHNRPGAGLFGAGTARRANNSDRLGAYAPVATVDNMVASDDDAEQGSSHRSGGLGVQMSKVPSTRAQSQSQDQSRAPAPTAASASALSPRSRRELMANAAAQRLAAVSGGGKAAGTETGQTELPTAHAVPVGDPGPGRTSSSPKPQPKPSAPPAPAPAPNSTEATQRRSQSQGRGGGAGSTGEGASTNSNTSAGNCNDGSVSVDEKDVELLVSMGFQAARAEEALRQCDGSINDAITMLACE